MNSRILILAVIAALIGCSRSVEWTGMPEFDFHGVKVALPQSGRGKGSLTSDTFTWRQDALTLILQDMPDGSVQIRRNGTTIGTARSGQSVRFTDDGQIESQK